MVWGQEEFKSKEREKRGEDWLRLIDSASDEAERGRQVDADERDPGSPLKNGATEAEAEAKEGAGEGDDRGKLSRGVARRMRRTAAETAGRGTIWIHQAMAIEEKGLKEYR
ncbi:hypothetical protein ColKHC_10902 [Colletotrichum higginsianum]|nr:hypothetical protein ColKHC_10902 [Colletotrichum higginsianum]